MVRGPVNQRGARVNTKLVKRRHNFSKFVELSPALDHIKGTDLDEAALCRQVYQQSNTYYELLAIGKFEIS